MMAFAAPITSDTIGTRLATRADLTGFLTQLSDEIGADSYMLVAIIHGDERNDARIVASNWLYDAIELVGKPLLATLANGPLTTPPGSRPRALIAAYAETAAGLLNGEQARLLDVLGHAELYSLRLDVGRQRLFVLFSAATAGSIEPAALNQAQLKCCYALSQVPQLLTVTTLQDPLSDRERECLFWVSEGKTTEEVALILGVSANTVNSYITHAIQKFSASNRVMAIATAIRSGII
ncbi:helix-turn-helix transcriptional regulator [Mesorhizobium retamae]|uniref:LuxR C-terminal-related transcriptional regulator n=1 Tax=Mesorhizobium retamae TaxID=2912854 RepID=A0ABS9QB95_9HYPH|nr:helix-turn-helix transcriptional regulator [Mesorhizobium sp. IRAMC:0171]MCG7504655.1 LuxR C-terminal-related transcriptional regulator [Mesorhizobium sp. IRAMC:0171]